MKKISEWVQQLLFNVDFSEAIDEAFRDYARISNSQQPPEIMVDDVPPVVEDAGRCSVERQRTIPPQFFGVIKPAEWRF